MSIRHFLFVIFYSSLSICRLFAGGIATSFADVVVEGLFINKEYNLTVSHNLPLKVINRSDGPMDVVIMPQIPKYNVKPGYEPIPDISWIKIVDSNYKLDSNNTGVSNVFIKIPKDRKLQGRNFQVNIEICGYPKNTTGGVTIVPSLLSKVRFSVEKNKKKFLFW